MTDDGFAAFASDSENWCCGPLLEAEAFFGPEWPPASAWMALWEDPAVSGPWEDTALTRKVAPLPSKVWSYSRESKGPADPIYSQERPPLRCGILTTPAGRLGFRALLVAPAGARQPYAGGGGHRMAVLIPPRMISRVAPKRWDDGYADDPPTRAVFDTLIAMLRRIAAKVPFRLASLCDEDAGIIPELAKFEDGRSIREGSIIVDSGFAEWEGLVDVTDVRP